MSVLQSKWMEKALCEARLAAERGEVPVGCVIVGADEVLAVAGNRVLELQDPTAHAELLAIRAACEKTANERLTDCDLYVTLEPCPMCAQAISFARIRRLYYAAPDPKGGGVDHGAKIYSQSTCHHRPDIYSGLGEKQSAQLLRDFFAERR